MLIWLVVPEFLDHRRFPLRLHRGPIGNGRSSHAIPHDLKGNKMKITFAKEQVVAMINIIKSDMEMSEHNQPDYADVEEMRYYSDRAEIFETLKMHMGAS